MLTIATAHDPHSRLGRARHPSSSGPRQVTVRATDAESGVSAITLSYVGPGASLQIIYDGMTRTAGTA